MSVNQSAFVLANRWAKAHCDLRKVSETSWAAQIAKRKVGWPVGLADGR